MPIGSDYRQAIILAVENQGTQAVDQLRSSLKVVQEQIDGWNRALDAGTTATTTYIAAVAKLTQVQNDLKAALETTREAEGRAKRERIEAIAREEREVEKLVASSERMKATYASNAAAGAFVTRQSKDLSDVMEGLAQHEIAAATATTTFTTAASRQSQAIKEAAAHTAGFASAADMATNQQKKFAYAILNVSHAAQDWAQGGAAAMLNNIPLVTSSVISAVPALEKMTASIGGAAGLSGAFMLAGTAAYTLYNYWTPLMTAMGASEGILRPVLDHTAELKNKLEAASKVTDDLGKKTHLTTSELKQYKEATAQVRELNAELEKRRDLDNILSGKSKGQREAGSAFQEAVAESGGGIALDNLDTAIGQGADAKGLVFNEYRGKMTKPRELAEDLIREGGGGDKRARGQVLGFLGAAFKPREGDFASNIRKTMPETVEAEKQAAKDADDEARWAEELREETRRVREKNEREKNRDADATAREEAAQRRQTEQAARQNEALAGRDKRGQLAQARDAAKAADHGRDMGFAQEFQRVTGANDLQANEAGKQIGNLVEKGASPAVAAQQVYDQMMRVILKQQASMDMITGINSGAIDQLRILDARADNLRGRIQGVRGNQRRMGNQKPPIALTF